MSREHPQPWLEEDWSTCDDEGRLKRLLARTRSLSFDTLSAALALANRIAADTAAIEAMFRGDLMRGSRPRMNLAETISTLYCSNLPRKDCQT